ncbi:hypothetical protein [Candidatus Ichthyocystis sparus]|uniref:hypothetical protein n=1 Tax=Candidatus Ichthyocystis sparus TaxID=1561004 RepID=UPI00159EF2E5|nr:hypothetical protein [Candidatus Ichthyocystis sparus]
MSGRLTRGISDSSSNSEYSESAAVEEMALPPLGVMAIRMVPVTSSNYNHLCT